MTLRVKKTEEICEKYNSLERKYHSEKSVFFSLPRTPIDQNQNLSEHYLDYYTKTQENLKTLFNEYHQLSELL